MRLRTALRAGRPGARRRARREPERPLARRRPPERTSRRMSKSTIANSPAAATTTSETPRITPAAITTTSTIAALTRSRSSRRRSASRRPPGAAAGSTPSGVAIVRVSSYSIGREPRRIREGRVKLRVRGRARRRLARLQEALARAGDGRSSSARCSELGALYRGAAADLAFARRRFPAIPWSRGSRRSWWPAAARSTGRRRAAGRCGPSSRAATGGGSPSAAADPRRVRCCSRRRRRGSGRWRDPGARSRARARRAAGGGRPAAEGRDFDAATGAAFSAGVMVNNIQVTLTAFAGGILAGAGTGELALLFNGMILGVVGGLAFGAGNGTAFLRLASSHGPLELSCIVVGGVAGLRLGWAIVAPSPGGRGRSRREAATPWSSPSGPLRGSWSAAQVRFTSPGSCPVRMQIAIGGSLCVQGSSGGWCCGGGEWRSRPRKSRTGLADGLTANIAGTADGLGLNRTRRHGGPRTLPAVAGRRARSPGSPAWSAGGPRHGARAARHAGWGGAVLAWSPRGPARRRAEDEQRAAAGPGCAHTRRPPRTRGARLGPRRAEVARASSSDPRGWPRPPRAARQHGHRLHDGAVPPTARAGRRAATTRALAASRAGRRARSLEPAAWLQVVSARTTRRRARRPGERVADLVVEGDRAERSPTSSATSATAASASSAGVEHGRPRPTVAAPAAGGGEPPRRPAITSRSCSTPVLVAHRPPEPRRRAPVDLADVVVGQVVAHELELGAEAERAARDDALVAEAPWRTERREPARRGEVGEDHDLAGRRDWWSQRRAPSGPASASGGPPAARRCRPAAAARLEPRRRPRAGRAPARRRGLAHAAAPSAGLSRATASATGRRATRRARRAPSTRSLDGPHRGAATTATTSAASASAAEPTAGSPASRHERDRREDRRRPRRRGHRRARRDRVGLIAGPGRPRARRGSRPSAVSARARPPASARAGGGAPGAAIRATSSGVT